ncbi:MAG: kinase [Thermodesulfobacteriota bacterium]
MIISRTPFRISFFGGGTDYPGWYLQNGGQVLSTSIDKYCYISLRYLPPFFEHKYRIVYSKIENVVDIDEIMHPAVRETLRYTDFTKGLEIHHDGDLPARSGMGSSSSFTVGLLKALYALKGRITSKHKIMMESIHIEQDMIGETVGSQDQAAASYGGLNHIVFHRNGGIDVEPLTVSIARAQELNDHLMLFYTGIMRTASEVAKSYVETIEAKERQLRRMHAMVEEGLEIINSRDEITAFGQLLHEAWVAKRQLSDRVSNPVIENLYERSRKAGAVGGKLTGAGGGGFLLLFVPPGAQRAVRDELKELLHVPFKFDTNGSQIIFYDPHIDDYSDMRADNDRNCLRCFRELTTVDPNHKEILA